MQATSLKDTSALLFSFSLAVFVLLSLCLALFVSHRKEYFVYNLGLISDKRKDQSWFLLSFTHILSRFVKLFVFESLWLEFALALLITRSICIFLSFFLPSCFLEIWTIVSWTVLNYSFCRLKRFLQWKYEEKRRNYFVLKEWTWKRFNREKL